MTCVTLLRFLATQTKCKTLTVAQDGTSFISIGELCGFFESASNDERSRQAVIENLRLLGLQAYIKAKSTATTIAKPTTPATATAAAAAPATEAGRCPHCSKWLVVGERACREHVAREEQLRQLHPWAYSPTAAQQ